MGLASGTVVFDEIDVGIGARCRSGGRRLKDLHGVNRFVRHPSTADCTVCGYSLRGLQTI